jgi:hypothetical protein
MGVPCSETWVDFREISSLETPIELEKEELGIVMPPSSSTGALFLR